MEEMKKDENLEAQEAVVEETVEETMETVEAEAVEEGEMEVLDEKDEKIAQLEQQAADNLDKCSEGHWCGRNQGCGRKIRPQPACSSGSRR